MTIKYILGGWKDCFGIRHRAEVSNLQLMNHGLELGLILILLIHILYVLIYPACCLCLLLFGRKSSNGSFDVEGCRR